MLEIRDLSKRYPSRSGRGSPPVVALDGVSLALAPGEFVAVRGPSGSGKSTLLLAAGGLLAPTGGLVAFEGQDLYGLSPAARARWRARHVGFVFQQFYLIPYLSVLDNVLAPALAWRLPEPRRRAAELLDRFSLADRAAHVPAELSVGQQQRTALARALLHRPRLLLCDEPTGNLDDQSAEVVLECLSEFQRDGGAVLLVTHYAGAARRAGRTVLLEAGRIAAVESPV
ncbi:MAG: ABC transporter ATP-binding protein [Thermoguttaceae bacterium]|jgi:ABC-type lipoprotein export system ATPase subunit